MNYFVFSYTNKNGEEKELRLRLTSADAMEIENIKKKKITEYLQEESMTMVITLLRYLLRWENKNYSLSNAQQLYDELIDSGMSMKKILTDIIYEALVVSGFLEKSEWEEMKQFLNKTQEKKKQIIMDEIL